MDPIMKFDTRRHRKGRPSENYTILARLNDDGTWGEDDGQPALAFECVLGHYHYVISACCSCFGESIDKCPREYAMSSVCHKHGAANGDTFSRRVKKKKTI